MILNPLTSEQCINKLRTYANKKVRSWNPFRLFRKRKLKNHQLAADLAEILAQDPISDTEFLETAAMIGKFEDFKLEHDLLCFIYGSLSNIQNPFMAKQEHVDQINTILQGLMNKQYRPWWALFLIKLPYYSSSFRASLSWLISEICALFTRRKAEIKEHLITVYANDEIANQISTAHQHQVNSQKDAEDELSKILETSLDQTKDQTQRVLIKTIKEQLITNVPFGKLLISSAALLGIITSYLSKDENKAKPKEEQAKELIYIIGKVFLKTNAIQMANSLMPGSSEIVDAVVSVVSSKSALNPMDKDRKIANAVAGAAGGVVGGAIGSVVPVVGSALGAYVGAVIGKTAASRFYQVLEVWERAPKGSESIIPNYPRSLFALVDNDAHTILEPLYQQYLETEKKSKILGNEIAKWLSIYASVQNTAVSEEYLEIIDEEMKALQAQFRELKDNHSKIVQALYKKQADNEPRVKEYISAVKVCLMPLHKPIKGMLSEYFSPDAAQTDTQSYTEILNTLPQVSARESSLSSSTNATPKALTKQSVTERSPVLQAPNFEISSIRLQPK